jgi:hypothetical protein
VSYRSVIASGSYGSTTNRLLCKGGLQGFPDRTSITRLGSDDQVMRGRDFEGVPDVVRGKSMSVSRGRRYCSMRGGEETDEPIRERLPRF